MCADTSGIARLRTKATGGRSPIRRRARDIFVDRVEPIRLFREAAASIPEAGSSLLVFYGVGGQGKTHLCGELIRICASEPTLSHVRHGMVDLHAFARNHAHLVGSPAFATVLVRNALMQTAGPDLHLRFPQYDLAFAAYWNEVAPESAMPLRESFLTRAAQAGSDSAWETAAYWAKNVLQGAVDEIPGLKSIAKLGGWMARKGWEAQLKRHSPVLQELLVDGELPPANEIERYLPALLAADLADLRERDPACRFAVFVDEYETVQHFFGGAGERRQNPFDLAMQDLIVACSEVGALFVFFSRVQLDWDEREPEVWGPILKEAHHLLEGLADSDAYAFLDHVPIDDQPIREAIVNNARSIEPDSEQAMIYPLMLDLFVDLYAELPEQERKPKAFQLLGEDFADKRLSLVQRLLRQIPPPLAHAIKRLSAARWFDRSLFEALVAEFRIPLAPDDFNEIIEFSLVSCIDEADQRYALHGLVAETLRTTMTAQDLAATRERIAAHHHGKALGVDAVYDPARMEDVAEAIYQKSATAPAEAVILWSEHGERVLGRREAVTCLAPVLASARGMAVPDDDLVSSILYIIGASHLSAGQATLACTALEEALAAHLRASNGARDRDYYSIIMLLASAQIHAGQLDQMKRSLEQALPDETTLSDGISSGSIDWNDVLLAVMCLMRLGDIARCRQIAEIAQRQEEPPPLMAIKAMADVFVAAGQRDVAAGLLQRLEERITQTSENDLDKAGGFAVLANWRLSEGRVDDAEHALTEARNIAYRFFDETSPLLLSLSLLEQRIMAARGKTGDRAAVKDNASFLDGLRGLAQGSPGVASMLAQQLASTATDSSDLDAEREAAQIQFDAARTIGPAERADACIRLAMVCVKQGKPEEAERHAQSALVELRPLGESHSGSLRYANCMLANAKRDLGEFEAAEHASLEAAGIGKAHGWHAVEAGCRGCAAEAAARAGRSQDACAHLATALDLASADSAGIHAGLIDRLAAVFDRLDVTQPEAKARLMRLAELATGLPDNHRHVTRAGLVRLVGRLLYAGAPETALALTSSIIRNFEASGAADSEELACALAEHAVSTYSCGDFDGANGAGQRSVDMTVRLGNIASSGGLTRICNQVNTLNTLQRQEEALEVASKHAADFRTFTERDISAAWLFIRDNWLYSLSNALSPARPEQEAWRIVCALALELAQAAMAHATTLKLAPASARFADYLASLIPLTARHGDAMAAARAAQTCIDIMSPADFQEDAPAFERFGQALVYSRLGLQLQNFVSRLETIAATLEPDDPGRRQAGRIRMNLKLAQSAATPDLGGLKQNPQGPPGLI